MIHCVGKESTSPCSFYIPRRHSSVHTLTAASGGVAADHQRTSGMLAEQWTAKTDMAIGTWHDSARATIRLAWPRGMCSVLVLVPMRRTMPTADGPSIILEHE